MCGCLMATTRNHAAPQLVVCNEGEHRENFVADVESNPVTRDENECLGRWDYDAAMRRQTTPRLLSHVG